MTIKEKISEEVSEALNGISLPEGKEFSYGTKKFSDFVTDKIIQLLISELPEEIVDRNHDDAIKNIKIQSPNIKIEAHHLNREFGKMEGWNNYRQQLINKLRK